MVATLFRIIIFFSLLITGCSSNNRGFTSVKMENYTSIFVSMENDTLYSLNHGLCRGRIEKKHNGIYIEFWEENKIKMKVPIIKGKFHGPMMYYRPNGTLMQIVHFSNGIVEGESLQFDETGCLKVN